MAVESLDTNIPSLGPAKIASPVKRQHQGLQGTSFVSDDNRVVVDLNISNLKRLIEEGKNLLRSE